MSAPRPDDTPLRGTPPEPLTEHAARRYLARRAAGEPFRRSFELLLADLDERREDLLLQLSKESHGAPALLLDGDPQAERVALWAGNALWGGVGALARLGWRVLVLDPSPSRAAVAADAHGRHPGAGVVGLAGRGRVPLRDRSVDLVVAEDPGPFPLAELARVARGDVLVLCDNRFGYKRSRGGFQDLHLRRPIDLLRALLRPAPGERTLGGHRRALARAGLATRRVLAPYPDRRDFSQVVGLARSGPHLQLGPGERRNRLKTAARALGLFPLLTPSFALLAAKERRPLAPTQLERVLAELAERLGEPRPEVEHLIATRGNTAVVHTRVAGAPPEDPAGRWTLHVPLHPPHRRGLELHLAFLREVAATRPGVPVPEALFAGEAAGVWVSVERRLPGVAAHHFTARADVLEALLAQGAEHATLLAGPPGPPLDEEAFDAHVVAKLRFLSGGLHDGDLLAELGRRVEEARRVLLGRSLPRVVQHGDLRPKHVQIDAQGRVLGYLDWGTASHDELPGFDLVHLVVHARPRRPGELDATVWRRLMADEIPGPERAALDRHRRDLGLEPEVWRALLGLYPLRLAHVAESNWPFGRPGWMRKRLGL